MSVGAAVDELIMIHRKPHNMSYHQYHSRQPAESLFTQLTDPNMANFTFDRVILLNGAQLDVKPSGLPADERYLVNIECTIYCMFRNVR